MSKQFLAHKNEIPSGTMKTFTVHGKTIAVANIDGMFFAVDDQCTHDACSLGEMGFVDGSTVTCGCHGAQFNLENGKVLSLPATEDIGTYSLKKEGDDLYIEFSS